MADLLAYGEDIIGFPGGEATAKVKLMKLLWENSDPTQAMASDTEISIKDADYDLIAYICFLRSSNNKVIPLVLTPKNKDAYVCYADANASLQRRFDYSNGKVTAKAGYIGNAVDNTYIILYQIYGIKLEQEIPVVAENVSTLAANCLLSDGETSVEDVVDELTANIIDGTYVSLDYQTEYIVPNDGYVRGLANAGTAKYVDLQVKLSTGEWITIARGGGTQTISDVEALFVKKGMHIKVIGSASADVICRYYPIITE